MINVAPVAPKYWLKDMGILTVFFAVFFGLFLGTRPLSSPDEGRYAEIPREMTITGDYVTPHLNGVKYFEKPVLMYWIETVPIRLFGLNEWSLRLVPFLFGLLGVLAVYGFGRPLLGRRAAILGAAILGTSLLYYAHTRLLILDLSVSVFLSAALLSFLCAAVRPNPRGYLVGFFTLMALATLTKGLMAIVIGGGIILAWTVPFRRWGPLKMAFTPWGIMLFLAIAAPWHILVSLKNPEFPWFYFVHEHFLRFLTTAHRRYQPMWFFIPIIIGGFVPWTGLLYDSLKGALKTNTRRGVIEFLLIAAGFIFVFFSLSHSKLIPYILPIFPFLSLVMGAHVDRALSDPDKTQTLVRHTIWVPAGLGGATCILLPVVYAYDLYDINAVFYLACLLGGIGLLLAIVPPLCVRRGAFRSAITAMVLLMGGFYSVLNFAWPTLEDRSVKSLALTLLKTQKPGDIVASYGRYYQDLPVYLNQTVHIVNWRGELDYGMKNQDTSPWMIDYNTFWTMWSDGAPRRVCAIMRHETYESLKNEQTIFLLGHTYRDALACNKPEATS